MISSRNDLNIFLQADSMAYKGKGAKRWLFNSRWRYIWYLRHWEFFLNVHPRMFIFRTLFCLCTLHLGERLGFSIPPNTFGYGLIIAHTGDIIINGKVRIGKNCHIHPGVVIGTEGGSSDKVPIIGDNCFIAPGAKIFGEIIIGNNVAIGANAVVNKSFPSDVTIVGVPARIINNKGTINREKPL